MHNTGKLFYQDKNSFATVNYFRSQRQSYRLGRKNKKTFKEHERYKPVFVCVNTVLCFLSVLPFLRKGILASQFLAFGHLDKGAYVHLLK